jgi:hypothetical protein
MYVKARIRTVGFGNEPVCSWALEIHTACPCNALPSLTGYWLLVATDLTLNSEPTRRSLVDVPIIYSGSQVEGPPTFLGVKRVHAPPTVSAGVDTILDIFRKTLRVLRGLGTSPLASSREPKRPVLWMFLYLHSSFALCSLTLPVCQTTGLHA